MSESSRKGSRRVRGQMVAQLALLIALCAPLSAFSASLSVDVVDQSGAPVLDAVITAVPTSGSLPPRVAGRAIIDQIDKQFVPLVSVIQTGTFVTFPNKDNIEHDVYSFSAPKTFELNLYSGFAAPPVQFDKPGLVVLGCNIHDKMIAYIQVVDTPYFGKTDAAGHLQLLQLPPDSYELTAWSYRLSDPKTTPHLTVHVETSAPAHFVLQLQSA